MTGQKQHKGPPQTPPGAGASAEGDAGTDRGKGQGAASTAGGTGASPPAERMQRSFAVMTEIGILAQLSAAAFERRMPGWLVAHFALVRHLLRRAEGATPLELARAFQQPKTTMTHTLQVLERRGLITMQPNPRDGRSKLVMLTEEGRAFHGRAMAEVARNMEGLHARLAPGTLEALLPHLEHLREVMEALRDD